MTKNVIIVLLTAGILFLVVLGVVLKTYDTSGNRRYNDDLDRQTTASYAPSSEPSQFDICRNDGGEVVPLENGAYKCTDRSGGIYLDK